MEPGCEREQRLCEVAFAIIDVETTGLNPAYGHRVCEVACLRVRGGVEEGRLESLVDPERSISAGAFRVNQITAEMLEGAPAFGEVGGRLLALMEGALLVAHNAPFDLGFLAAELEIARLPPPEGQVVDTLALARRGYSFPSNSLGVVASHLEVEMETAHRAMADVQTTWQVLERMLWDLDRRWGVTTVGQLIDFQGGPIPYPLPHLLPLPPALAEALEARGRVQMRYVDARGVETTREVRPLRVQEQGGHLYLLAHCFRAEALRTFRLDRVVEMAGEG
jgi:DNA polymerase-3 subunit epsilon